jgi:CDGSH-type Zn-finger protein
VESLSPLKIVFATVADRRYKEGMSEPIIAQKSPIVQKVEPGTYFWCARGKSKSQPFCDGAHKGTGFVPLKTEIKEAKTVAWCGCKHTKNAPFCDGSHAKLP